MSNLYDTNFYARQAEGSLRSSEIMVPLIIEFFKPRSVVDFGCGVGAWLRVFRECGVEIIRGYEINTLKEDELLISPEFMIQGHDFSTPDFQPDRHWDLAICLEVAEHIRQESAAQLIENLCKAAPAIVFSAAIPGQTGVAHINEQPHSYWRELFLNLGFVEFDALRPLVHNQAQVRWWYRQNMLMYVSRKKLTTDKSLAQRIEHFQTSDESASRLTMISSAILEKRATARLRAGKILEQLAADIAATGNKESAAVLLELVLSLEIKDQSLFMKLAEIYHQLGKEETAQVYSQRAREYEAS